MEEGRERGEERRVEKKIEEERRRHERTEQEGRGEEKREEDRKEEKKTGSEVRYRSLGGLEGWSRVCIWSAYTISQQCSQEDCTGGLTQSPHTCPIGQHTLQKGGLRTLRNVAK